MKALIEGRERERRKEKNGGGAGIWPVCGPPPLFIETRNLPWHDIVKLTSPLSI